MNKWFAIAPIGLLAAYGLGAATGAEVARNATTHNDLSGVAVGGSGASDQLPATAMFGYGSGGNAERVSSSIDAPITSALINSTGTAAYSRCNGGRQRIFTNCVGLLGVGLLGANSRAFDGASGGAWGVNGLAVNGPAAQSGANAGFDFGFLGNEFDVNVLSKAGGVPPTGNAIGLFVNNASAVAPTGLYNAVQVAAAGTPWKDGLFIEPGAADTGIFVGSRSKTAASGSTIILDAKDASGGDHHAEIGSDAAGNLEVTPSNPSHGGYLKVNGGVVTNYVYTVASLPNCSKDIVFFRTFVIDARDTTYPIGAAITGGGAARIPTFCNGVSWVAG